MGDFILSHRLAIYGVLTLIIFGLSIYLGYILRKLTLQKQLEKKATRFLAMKNEERHQYRIESIRTIALAALQDQCELSEACLRIKKLLEYYPSFEKDENFKIIQEMFVEIKDFATLSDRKELSKQERYNQDKKRFQIENKFEKELKDSLALLKDQILDANLE